MDAERFGRALGVGVREGAKALLRAADAAAAPNPRPVRPATTPDVRPSEGQAGRAAGRAAARGVVEARRTGQALSRGGKRFGETVWGPAARAGGVLWFEVTGVFFGLFMLAAGAEVWKRRAGFTTAGEPRQKVFFAVLMLLVFGWFTLQSFRKARARERR